MSQEPIKIHFDDKKPHLTKLLNEDRPKALAIIGTFVECMELAAQHGWHELPNAIHSSVSFNTMILAVLEGVLTTKEYPSDSYSALENEVHPLSLLSDQKKDLLTGEDILFDWKKHFNLDSDELTKENIATIIRKMFYLMRWFDIDTVSKALYSSSFPIVDSKNIEKLPFQPALKYQQQIGGDLHAGSFLQDVGLLDCGTITPETEICPSCSFETLETLPHHENIKGCRRCNAGFVVEVENE